MEALAAVRNTLHRRRLINFKLIYKKRQKNERLTSEPLGNCHYVQKPLTLFSFPIFSQMMVKCYTKNIGEAGQLE